MSNDAFLSFSRRALRSIFTRLHPLTPFDVDNEDKGFWAAFANAQPHIWRNYKVSQAIDIPATRTLRFIVLSDLHVGSHSNDLERLTRIVEEVSQKQFDVLLLPGDFVNMQIFGGGRVRPERIAEALVPLVKTVPTFAVLGNHDSEYGADQVEQCLSDAGIQVLRNSSARCSESAANIYIVGLEDESTGFPDFEKGSQGIPDAANILVMAHDPASLMRLPDQPMLVVSGHTHGGQVRLPWFGPVINASAAPLAWSHGHVTLGHRQLIVSAGLGTSVMPFRFLCSPEIVEIELAM